MYWLELFFLSSCCILICLTWLFMYLDENKKKLQGEYSIAIFPSILKRNNKSFFPIYYWPFFCNKIIHLHKSYYSDFRDRNQNLHCSDHVLWVDIYIHWRRSSQSHVPWHWLFFCLVLRLCYKNMPRNLSNKLRGLVALVDFSLVWRPCSCAWISEFVIK